MIDINKLTLGEIAKVEDLSGLPIAAFSDESKPKGLALAALAFVWKRRSAPTFTWNDAQGLELGEAQAILGITDDDDEGEPIDLVQVPDADTDEVQADPFESQS